MFLLLQRLFFFALTIVLVASDLVLAFPNDVATALSTDSFFLTLVVIVELNDCVNCLLGLVGFEGSLLVGVIDLRVRFVVVLIAFARIPILDSSETVVLYYHVGVVIKIELHLVVVLLSLFVGNLLVVTP